MTPQQEHAISDAALQYRQAEKNFSIALCRDDYEDYERERLALMAAKHDLYVLLDAALLRDLTTTEEE